MVVKIPKACKNCGHVTDEDKCPLCGGETSRDWQGYVIIVDRGRTPDVCVVDFKTKRQEDPELREALQRVGSRALRVVNAAGSISADAWSVLSEAFKSKERVRVEVRGEEDLLTLVCLALAPESAAVLYGMPSQGVVVVRADSTAKTKVLDILRRMER